MDRYEIFSRNARYQRIEVLKSNRLKRRRLGLFFVEGVRNIEAALRFGWEIEAFLTSRTRRLSSWAESVLSRGAAREHWILEDELMREASGKEETSELLAIVRMRQTTISALPLPAFPLLALFDRPSSRGNLGAILRSCDALGVNGLYVTGHGVDLYDPETVGATMGSFFAVPAQRLDGGEDLREELGRLRERFPALRLVATSARAASPLECVDLTGPTVLLIGNETDGLAKGLRELADEMAAIPMAEGCAASSLNVACAASILFYEAERQRRAAARRPLRATRGRGKEAAGLVFAEKPDSTS